MSAPTISPRKRYGTTLSALKTLISAGPAFSTVTISTWKATPAIALPKARIVLALQNRAKGRRRRTSLGRADPPAPSLIRSV